MEKEYLIRSASITDIDSILAIVEDARALARKLNSKQWLSQDGYPNYQTFYQDILSKALFVAIDKNFVVGVIYISNKLEPTYQKIEAGSWLTSNLNYGVIHRLAVKASYYGQGVSTTLMKFAQDHLKSLNVKSIRIDTAKQNQPMLRLIEKMGYKYCGIIKLGKYSGEEDQRLAFEKII